MSVLPVGAAAGASLWPTIDTSQVGATSSPTSPTSATLSTGAASGATGDSFASMMGNALDSVSATQANADSLANQAATGSLTNVADYMVAAEDANIQTSLTAAVKNSALQAFQSIMGMQL